MKQLFKQIISDFHVKKLKNVKKRELEVDINSGKIISIIGPRRAGKSSYLFSIMKDLINSGIKKSEIVYINFEDERIDLFGADLSIILDTYRELYPKTDLQNVYFFFDEIQNINSWEKFIRRIYDEGISHIFITGSNSKLLSTEIATALRGRSLAYELLPLSFTEFLNFSGFEGNEFSSKGKTELILAQNRYLRWGGFPELISLKDDTKTKILQEYYNVMVYNDIVERYAIKDTSLLKNFIKLALQSTAKEFSINKIANTLKTQGFKFDKAILYDFLDYLNTVYFFGIISKGDKSAKKQVLKKIYTFDTGYLQALNFRFSSDDGKRLENTIFISLYRKYGNNIIFMKNGYETDFIVQDRENTHIYQSCYELNAENKSRKIKGCVKAMKEFGVNEATIITYEQEDELEVDGCKIRVVPFYKWGRMARI